MCSTGANIYRPIAVNFWTHSDNNFGTHELRTRRRLICPDIPLGYDLHLPHIYIVSQKLCIPWSRIFFFMCTYINIIYLDLKKKKEKPSTRRSLCSAAHEIIFAFQLWAGQVRPNICRNYSPLWVMLFGLQECKRQSWYPYKKNLCLWIQKTLETLACPPRRISLRYIEDGHGAGMGTKQSEKVMVEASRPWKHLWFIHWDVAGCGTHTPVAEIVAIVSS